MIDAIMMSVIVLSSIMISVINGTERKRKEIGREGEGER
jgi:hypothetical protein